MLIEMTCMYQFLLQKAKLENDKQTYKQIGGEAIGLMIKNYPKNPDILTTYSACCEIYQEEKNFNESLKLAKECYSYVKNHFEKESNEFMIGAQIYSKALFYLKNYEECLKIAAEIYEVADKVFSKSN